MQNDIDAITGELNAVMRQAKPLLERQKFLQNQVDTIDAQANTSLPQSDSLATSANMNSDLKLSASPSRSRLRKAFNGQEMSSAFRNRSQGQQFSKSGKGLHDLPSPARQHDIDLATEIGEGLVEEVRKLQAQLYEKDEFLKELTRSRVKQERISEELEGKLKTMLSEEGKALSIDFVHDSQI